MRVVRGFTLVEVVIALALLSLVMLGLLGAMRTLGDSGSRLDARAMRGDELRLSATFLREAIGLASPRSYQRPGDLEVRGYFLGNAQSLEWLGVMPARHGAGGISHMRLLPAQEGRVLVLQVVPFDPQRAEPDWSQAEEAWLVEDLEQLVIQYQALEGADWRNEWSVPSHLPGRVQIQIQAAGYAWPPLIIAVQAARPGAPAT